MTQYVQLEDHRNYVVLKFSGLKNLDANTALRIKAEIKGLIADNVKNVLIDLSEVSFIDSTGFGALISVLKTIKSREGKLILVGVTPEVRELMDLMQLLNVFELADNIDFAVQTL